MGDTMRLLLAGDVMIGRGIDQALAHSVDPVLYESHVTDARDYVALAERANGPIPRPLAPAHVWGDLLADLDELEPDARIVNLETTLTTSDDPTIGKEVLYRSHPANAEVLAAARVDSCSLANNHALDWGRRGLLETLDAVRFVGVAPVGAGRDREAAEAPVELETAGGRVLVVAIGSTSSGVPPEWSATAQRAGIAVIDGWPERAADAIGERLARVRRAGDVVVASIHWGSNWGHLVPDAQRRLAHRLVEVAGVDVVHGHSSHHARPVEIHRGRLILHGCGDLVTDYEGIRGHGEYRPDLALAHLVDIDRRSGAVAGVLALPYRMRRFRLERASRADATWLAETLDRHSRPLAARARLRDDGRIEILPD